MKLTERQAELLEELLHDARTGWDIKIEFPASFADMIDARIAYEKWFIEHHGLSGASADDIEAGIAEYRELRRVLQGE